jgi:uncharacterized FlaG/YvyC family protein
MKYIKETTRITVKFIDAETEETILEVPDRNWMNVGQMFTATHGDSLIQAKLKGKRLPKKVLVLTLSELVLRD